MGLVLSGSGAGGDIDMTNEGVRVEAADNHGEVRHGAANIRAVYRGGEDGGIHKVTTVVGPRTRSHTGGPGGRVKEN